MHAALLSAVVLAATKKSSGSSTFPLLILVGLFFVAYFVLIRPARNRQRAAMNQQLEERSQISVGEEIITTSGLIATIVARTDDEVTLEIAPGVHARYVPAAIMRLREDEPPAEPDADDEATAEPDVSNHEVIEPDGSDPSADPPEEPKSS